MADNGEKNKEFSEDVRDKTKEDIQALTKKYEDEATVLAASREKDVTEN
jgi:ribosome recycling factor